MPNPLLIENARVIDPATGRDHIGAILIENGAISDAALMLCSASLLFGGNRGFPRICTDRSR